MAEKGGESAGPKAPAVKLDMASLTEHVLNECMFSLVHDLVLKTHREEKLLLQTLDPVTKLPICPNCNLPRLLDPPLAQSRPTSKTQYCAGVPWSTRPGHDIYGNPFPVAGSDKPPTKKEREAQSRLKAESHTPTHSKHSRSKDGTPGSPDMNGTRDSSPSEQPNIAGGPVDKKAAKVGERLKGGTYVPWHTCPSCKRSLLITRFAQHLEKCLGIGGRGARNAARNATAPSATPLGSRSGTPAANSRKDGTDDEEDDIKSGNVRKKVLKRGLKQSKKDGGTIKLAPPNGKAGGSSKRPPRSDDSSAKRDRDEPDEEDATPIRKKQKLQRLNSTASIATTSLASLQDNESVDGSFVNDSGEED